MLKQRAQIYHLLKCGGTLSPPGQTKRTFWKSLYICFPREWRCLICYNYAGFDGPVFKLQPYFGRYGDIHVVFFFSWYTVNCDKISSNYCDQVSYCLLCLWYLFHFLEGQTVPLFMTEYDRKCSTTYNSLHFHHLKTHTSISNQSRATNLSLRCFKAFRESFVFLAFQKNGGFL